MALFIQQNDTRTKLQQKLVAELREKSLKKAQGGERHDGVDDSAYLQGTKKTTSLAWAWVAVALLAIGALVTIVLKANT